MKAVIADDVVICHPAKADLAARLLFGRHGAIALGLSVSADSYRMHVDTSLGIDTMMTDAHELFGL